MEDVFDVGNDSQPFSTTLAQQCAVTAVSAVVGFVVTLGCKLTYKNIQERRSAKKATS